MKQRSSRHDQQGFLLISAVIMIVLIGLISSTMIYFSLTSAGTYLSIKEKGQSLNIAQTGLEKVKMLISNPPSAGKAISCLGADTDSAVNNINILGGQFSVSSSTSSPLQGNNIELQNPLNSTDTTIRVNDAAPLPQSGQIMIGLEKINYDGKSGDQLLNAQRGQDGTQAVSHRNQTPVTMHVCTLHVTGQYPATNLGAKSTLSLKTGTNDVWVSGNSNTGEPIAARWNGSSWTDHSADFVSSDQLENMTKVSYHDLWIAGQDNDSAAVFHWGGNNWAQPSDGPDSGSLLNDVSCISHDVCYAVGNQRTLFSINRNNWNSVGGQGQGNNAPPDVDYYAIDCPVNPSNANDRDCWAVGQSHNDSGQDELTMIHNTGSGNSFRLDNEDSTNQAITGTEDLQGIHCSSQNNCWAVGDNGIVLNWNGSGWSKNSTASNLTSHTLRSVYCLHTGECWAVGNAGTILHHSNSGSWSQSTSPTTNDLFAVDCSGSGDCWAVGQNSETIHRVNGQWQTESNSLATGTLTGVVDLGGSSSHFWDWTLS